MSCFNHDIAIGVTTDFENVDFETRFQMWGMYLWLSIYRIYVRMICQKQGDENNLKLPISYHPYYTQQSFQVGKRKLDICLSVGKKLTCNHLEQAKAQGSVFHENTRMIAYGPEETEQTLTSGWLRKKTEHYDLSYFDEVLAITPEQKKQISEILNKDDTKQLLNPYLLAEAVHYAAAARPQTLSKKPYVLVYASKMNQETIEQCRLLARTCGIRLAINEEIKEYATPYTRVYSAEELDTFYGILMGAKYVITDSEVVAGLTVERCLPLTTLVSFNGDLRKFVDKYNLEKTVDVYPLEKKEREANKALVTAAARMISNERFENYYYLEGLLGLARPVDAPTKIRMTECYGCFACRDVCPKGAITMEKDEEGFYYPKTNPELCVNCGLCEKHCIANEKKQYAAERVAEGDSHLPTARIAVCKSDDQLAKSTSGGAFRSLVRHFIEDKNGVVFGAAFDEDTRVVSMAAETMEEAHKFSGSKYVKSEFAHMFPKVKEYLDAGREVLYSGLPCENAALRVYLKKEYPNLTQCELICHGGASPKVFEDYVKHIEKKLKAKVTAVNFRDKRISWHQKDFKVTFSFEDREPFSVRGRQNNYMNAFLKNYTFRISCYRCQYAGHNRVADITIGDCHGVLQVAPEVYDPRGVSSIILNTKKGEQLWEAVKDDFNYIETTPARAYRKNHTRPSAMPEERALLMAKLDKVPINNLLATYNLHKASLEDTEI